MESFGNLFVRFHSELQVGLAVDFRIGDLWLHFGMLLREIVRKGIGTETYLFSL